MGRYEHPIEENIVICTIRATENEDGLPYFFEIINPYRVVKKVEDLIQLGYLIIIIDTDTIRYINNDNINCSCLSYPPNKKNCHSCRSNIKKVITPLEFLKGVK